MHPLTPRPDHDAQAMADLQAAWAPRVEPADRLGEVRWIAGVDVAYPAHGDRVFGGIALLDAQSLEVVETVTSSLPDAVPYVPGLLSFRELPPLLACFERLARAPDLIVCDGQGVAHPARFGLASHLGVLLDVPTIGCAKSRFVGRHAPLGPARGDTADLVLDGEVVGRALRTQDGVKPVYVSVGHRVSLDTAVAWVLRLAAAYRQPETTRAADHLVRLAAKGEVPVDVVAPGP
ncbi:MAG: deoxyribonuclease V [Myxococcales bacterium]|nr:deoxyribonuclease V [Myxococcales bacterium]MCB9526379.1 deoxyribonuclease V [Myxococcales bacterium]